jgi:hypothetical protein
MQGANFHYKALNDVAAPNDATSYLNCLFGR